MLNKTELAAPSEVHSFVNGDLSAAMFVLTRKVAIAAGKGGPYHG